MTEPPRKNYSMQGASRRSCIINVSCADGPAPPELVIVYEEPYQPIRMPKYTGTITVNDGKIIIPYSGFRAGDLIDLTIGAAKHKDMPLMEVTYDDGIFTLHVGGRAEITDGEYENAGITRIITDNTVCDTPYDNMYVNYVLAKTAQYQKDTAAYNMYISRFNTELMQYKEWLAARMPSEPYQRKSVSLTGGIYY